MYRVVSVVILQTTDEKKLRSQLADVDLRLTKAKHLLRIIDPKAAESFYT